MSQKENRSFLNFRSEFDSRRGYKVLTDKGLTALVLFFIGTQFSDCRTNGVLKKPFISQHNHVGDLENRLFELIY